MRQNGKRLISVLLTLVMLLGLAPGVAWADGPAFNGLSSGDTFESIVLQGNEGDATRTGIVSYVHGDAHTTASIEFKKWDSDNSLPTASGKYYLTQNVTLNAQWNINANITLCLNGHTIQQTGACSVIFIQNGFTLNLFDTTNGKITGGNSIYNGGGVFINRGTFNMYGGKLTGNRAGLNGSAVAIGDYGNFHMYGGEISGNTAGGYGAVCNSGSGTIGFSGEVVVRNNKAGSHEQEQASDVCLDGYYPISLDGPLSEGAQIGVSRRDGGDEIAYYYNRYMESTPPNTYFFSNDQDRMVVSVSEYGNVLLSAEPAEMTELTSWSDDSGSHAMQLGYGASLSGKRKASYQEDSNATETVIFSTELRKAASSTDSSDSATRYLSADDEYSYQLSGSYYLKDDLTLDQSLIVWDALVYLDLAGHTLTIQSQNPTVSVEGYGTLYLFDSSAGKGKINNGTGPAVRLSSDHSELVMFGGTLTGKSYGVQIEAGEYDENSFNLYGGKITGCGSNGVMNYDVFNMYGGEITENTVTEAGGGVFNNGSFTLYNGTISKNTTTENGGGVENNSGAFVMWGGTISENKATGSYRRGGGVSVSNGTFALRGGSIINNEAGNGGAGVFMNNTVLTVSGAPMVKDNKFSGNKTEASNIATYRLIAVDKALTEGAELGVTLLPDRNGERFMGGKGVFTTGAGVNATPQDTAMGYFTSDEGYTVLTTTEAADGVADQLKLGDVKFTLHSVYQKSDGEWPERPTGTDENGSSYTVSETQHYRAVGYNYAFDTGLYMSIPAGGVIPMGENHDLYVYYMPTFDVTFMKDAAKGEAAKTLTVLSRDKLGSLSGVPTADEMKKDGYYFAGWTTTLKKSYNYKNTVSGDGVDRDADGSEAYLMYDLSADVVSNLTLYPVFVKDRLNVVLVPDGGTLGTGYNGKQQKDNFTVNIDEPIYMNGLLGTTRAGYRLSGWYTKGGVRWNGEKWNSMNQADWWRMTPTYADSTTTQFESDKHYNYYTVTLTAHWEQVAEDQSGKLKVHYSGSPEREQITAEYAVTNDTDVIGLLKASITDKIDADTTRNQHYTYRWNPAPTQKYSGDIYLEWVPKTYTITLNKGNGSAPEVVSGIFGSVVSADNPTREGYTFLGWSLNGRDVAELPHYMPDDNPTYTALWGHTYDVGVTVLNKADNTAVTGAAVQLYRGSELYKTLSYSGSGVYSTSGIPDGDYTVVVKVGNKTVSELLKVSGANQEKTVFVPSNEFSSVVEVKPDTPVTMVGGLSELADTIVVGENESVEVKLTVQGKKDLTETPDSDLTHEQRTEKGSQQYVKTLAESSGRDNLEFIDMGILKTVVGGDNPGTSHIRESSAVLEIVVNYQTAGRYSFGVFRHHTDDNGKDSRLAFTALSSRPTSGFRDGTFYLGNGYLVVYADKFSTYAIGYTTTAPANNNNNNNNSNNNNYTGGGSGGSSDSDSSYPVTVGQSANGTVKADRSAASAGTRVTVTATPDSGCKVDSVTVTDKNGKSVPVTRNSDGTYRFNMPESAVTVNVTFAKKFADPAGTGVADWLNTDDHILYIRGYNENGVSTVRPDNNITRAEAAMMFYRLLKNQDVTVTKTFTDVSEGQWYAQPIGVLASLGIVGGYGDGTFLPNRTITRAEFAKIATRFAIATGGKAQFKDVSEGHWAGGFIATAADYGWIGGYEDGTYRPDGFMTRAAAAKIINYMLGRSADREYVLSNRENLVKYTDLTDPSVWYYFEIVEASVAHDFTVTDGVEKWK